MESAEREIARENQVLINVFSTPDGRKALEILRRQFHDRSVYQPGDPYQTCYKAGQQDVVGFILEAIKEKDDGSYFQETFKPGV